MLCAFVDEKKYIMWKSQALALVFSNLWIDIWICDISYHIPCVWCNDLYKMVVIWHRALKLAILEQYIEYKPPDEKY